jgi:hypothetical protein
MKSKKSVLGMPVGLGGQDLIEKVALKSLNVRLLGETTSQVTALMRPVAWDTPNCAALRASSVQGLAASVSRLNVGVAVQPSLLATTTMVERMSPTRALTESVRRLTALCAPSPALMLNSTLAERMSCPRKGRGSSARIAPERTRMADCPAP